MGKQSTLLYILLIIFFSLFNSQSLVKAQIDTTVFVKGTRVDIIFPRDNSRGKNILVLPGWNFPCDDICRKSNFCSLAIEQGYTIVLPDMKKSVYATRIYPETRPDWLQYHTRSWVTDTLIPYLQSKFQIFLFEHKNYLFGISTGGRGVALIACFDSLKLFRAGAALSGDFDQTLMLNDNLMKGYYGSYQKFPKRWEGEDNPTKNADKIRIPIYLAHGTDDSIVPYSQSVVFYDQLKKISSLPHQLHIVSGAKHSYEFWSTQYSYVLTFFDQY
ncbi:MAG: prolyl oligopeptidase family serine peptidase [Bacteroidales bacterium]|nr:prolyl oligopeptidase family serine peptidase [Bacteroidales bacterium]